MLFRARVSDIFLNKLEVFHVPFNKRYYIRNERFSLTGQPVLYLGNSIADLFEELNINYTDSQQLNMFRVASFEFSPDYEYNIFDLRCNIFSHLKNVKNPTFSKKTFFRNILASICSFQKRRELSECAFVEEYVIPQMLAQILKQNGYDGICYFSTKSFEDYSVNSSSNRLLISELNMAYRENYAIFTRMRGEEGYDTVLRDRLEISMPIALSNVRLCGEDDLHELVQTFSNQSKEAKNILSELNDDVTPNLLKKQRADAVIRNCTRAKTIVDSYKYIFGNLKYKNKEYSQTCLGRAQIQLLLGILNRLLAETVTEVEEVTEEIKTANDEMLSEEKVILCNIDGDEIEGADEKDMLYRETHMNGKLHKAIAVFVLHEGDIVLKTDAVSNTFYGHCRNNMLEKFDFAPHKTTTIGSFIYHEFEPVIHNQYGAFISDNFEFVEVVVMKADDILGYPVISIEELKTKFINQYDCFTPFMKQA